VVDSRFVLKLTDFGLPSLRAHNDLQAAEDAYVYYRGPSTLPELDFFGSDITLYAPFDAWLPPLRTLQGANDAGRS